MAWMILALAIVALGVSLRRAFVRIAELDRGNQSLAQRLQELQTEVRATGGNSLAREPASAPARVATSPPSMVRMTVPASKPVVVPPSFGATDFAGPATEHAEETTEHESLETQIGTKWLLYIGVIAIVIGTAYFEKLAIENQWFGETARLIQGAVLGVVLIVAGLRFVRAGYSVYGQMIAGGGAAILYLSTYAAFNFYHLIDRPLAFVLMLGITATVTWLADHLQSQGLALFAAAGGFGTPFLLPGTTDAQIALFGYDTILIAGTTLLSHRRNWPALNIVSYVLTAMTVAGWADRFYTPDKYLRTEVFITLFCAMFIYILRRMRKATGTGAEVATLVLWTTPAAYYMASLFLLQDHSTALLVWLVAMMLVGGVLSERVGSAAGLAVWSAVALPLLFWTMSHLGPGFRTIGLTTIAAVYLIALAAQFRRILVEPDGPEVADTAWLHLNGLVMFAAAYFLINASHAAIAAAFAAGFALWQWALAAAILTRRREEALHFAALGFTLLSIAIARQFDGPTVTIGWAAEGAVLVALGLRERRDWLRGAGALLFGVAFAQSMLLLSNERAVSEAVFFNPHAASAAAMAAFSYVIAWLHYGEPGQDAADRDLSIGVSLILAQVVTLALLTSEIHAYWALREGHLARELMVSITWGVYATALIVIGLQKRYAPIRYFAMVAFAATIFKVFALDMSELQRIYRVSSVIGLGVLLLLTSYLYSRSKRT